MQPNNAPEIKFDLDAVPAFRREELGRGALQLVEQAFAMPGAEERYQAWLVGYKRRQREAARAAR